jgi:hypothetical protein
MLRRRVLTDGDVFLEMRDARGELVAETVVPADLEADAELMLRQLAAKWERINEDRRKRGVLAFRRRLPKEAIPRRSLARWQGLE